MALLRTSAYDTDRYTSVSAPRSMLEAQQAKLYSPRSMYELQQSIAERPVSMLELQQATHTPFNEQLGENFTPVGQVPKTPSDPIARPGVTETAPLTGTPYQTPNVYLPSINGQTTDYQTALNRLAMGGSPYEALQGLLGTGQLAQQGSDGYTGTNAGNSGLLGATPINTGAVTGYPGTQTGGQPQTGGDLPLPVQNGQSSKLPVGPHRDRKSPEYQQAHAQRDVARDQYKIDNGIGFKGSEAGQVRKLAWELAGGHKPYMELLPYLRQARQQLGLPIYGE